MPCFGFDSAKILCLRSGVSFDVLGVWHSARRFLAFGAGEVVRFFIGVGDFGALFEEEVPSSLLFRPGIGLRFLLMGVLAGEEGEGEEDVEE